MVKSPWKGFTGVQSWKIVSLAESHGWVIFMYYKKECDPYCKSCFGKGHLCFSLAKAGTSNQLFFVMDGPYEMNLQKWKER